MRRMDRYNSENNTSVKSRSNKNEELYKEVSSNIIYANLTDVSQTNAYDITDRKKQILSSREDYHKLKEYSNVLEETQEKKKLEEYNKLDNNNDNKVYDINSIIEETRKNRKEKEEKNKKIDDEYNILSDENTKELEKYRKDKKERITPPDEKELREITDTILSKTLAGDISKETGIDLLGDLMATQALDKVEAQEDTSKEDLTIMTETKHQTIVPEKAKDETGELNQEELEKAIKENKKTKPDYDTDFYTRSMDLKEQDLLLDDDEDIGLPVWLKIILSIIIIGIIAGAGIYFYIKYFK